MSDFKYGDLVCYRGIATHHEGPIMVVGVITPKDAVASVVPCSPGDLRLMPIDDGLYLISTRAPEMWQKCEHLDG